MHVPHDKWRELHETGGGGGGLRLVRDNMLADEMSLLDVSWVITCFYGSAMKMFGEGE